MHCGRYQTRPISRRDMLRRTAMGFGAVAMSALAAEYAPASTVAKGARLNPLAPRPTHHRPRAKNVIFLYMDGGVSQVEVYAEPGGHVAEVRSSWGRLGEVIATGGTVEQAAAAADKAVAAITIRTAPDAAG